MSYSDCSLRDVISLLYSTASHLFPKKQLTETLQSKMVFDVICYNCDLMILHETLSKHNYLDN